MSTARVYPGGSLQENTVTFTAARWGGGADPGCWHIFASTGLRKDDWKTGLLPMSQQAVVDDFGNLVRVPS